MTAVRFIPHISSFLGTDSPEQNNWIAAIFARHEPLLVVPRHIRAADDKVCSRPGVRHRALQGRELR